MKKKTVEYPFNKHNNLQNMLCL